MMPKRSKKLVMQPTNSSVMSSGPGNQKILFDSPSVNTAGFTESSDVFTCTVPGVYWISVLFTTTAGAIGNMFIYKNGAVVATYSSIAGSTTAEFTYGLDISALVELAVGDTISFYLYNPGSITSSSDSNYKTVLELL